MAENYASKMAPFAQKRFSISSVTDGCFSKKYKFTGVKSIQILTPDLVTLNDYNRGKTGGRYGTANELGDTIQEISMSQDKSLTYTIDKGNQKDQLNIKTANSTLDDQMQNVVIPAVDKYRLLQLNTKAGLEQVTGELTKANIIEKILMAGATQSNKKVPRGNRILWVKETVAVQAALADQVMGNEKLSHQAITKGVIGHIGGYEIRTAPDDYFPDGTNYIALQKMAALAPVKIKDYKIHVDPPGTSGNLVEFRMYHDCFVIDTLKNGVLRGVVTTPAG